MGEERSGDDKVSGMGPALEIVNAAGALMVPAVASAVREAGVCFGLSAAAADELREACQAVLRRVADIYLGDIVDGRFAVTIHRRPGRVEVRIEDQGVPYELADAPSWPGLAHDAQAQLLALVGDRLDRFAYHYRGRAGNRIDLVKRITGRRPRRGRTTERPPVGSDQPVEVRAMAPGDERAFVRNIYRTFGYTYTGDWAYSAEEVGEQLEAGLLAAWVALIPDGTIVGAVALHREQPGVRICEGGTMVVDPAFRHRGLALKLALAAVEWIRQQELLGVFGFATTRHPYSQQAVLALGSHEVALLLGFFPSSVVYRGIDTGSKSRPAVMVLYQVIAPNPTHEVHAPLEHRDMLRRIYEHADLRGDFVESGEPVEPTGHTHVAVSIQTARALAELDVTAIGADLVDLVRAQLERLAAGGIATAYVDLPLSRPETPRACDELERLGLSFAGVFPKDDDAGMRLRLQRLEADAALDPDDIQVASDFGAALRDYVLDARARTSPAGR